VITAGQPVARIQKNGNIISERARYLYTFQGLEKVEV